ncbi:MAG: hypothetical protein EHM48_05495 [Planctomycetaceae bacterium]|nr:MAG: hypothetical protein EHM48_05495 [Planctomycetaceae bacterium]
MLSLRLRCPNPKCRVVLSIPEQLHGQHVKCAGCGTSFLVPPRMFNPIGMADHETQIVRTIDSAMKCK